MATRTSLPSSATALAIRCCYARVMAGNHGNRRVGMIVKQGDYGFKGVFLFAQERNFSSGKDDDPLKMFSTTRRRRGGGSSGNNRGKQTEDDPLELFKLRRAPNSSSSSSSSMESGEDHMMEPFQMLQSNRSAELRNHSIQLFPGDYQDEGGGDEDSFLGESVFGGGNDNSDNDFEVDEDYEEVEAAVKALKEEISKREEQKKNWIANAEQPDYQPKIDALGRAYGRGARKTAHARVWIQPGFGHVVVNKHDFIDYFRRRSDREKILDPLVVTDTVGEFDIKAIVRGGGLTGQANAIQLGVARALVNYRPDLWREPLKRMGLLTRDARIVERKKTGLVKARKAPQWNRR